MLESATVLEQTRFSPAVSAVFPSFQPPFSFAQLGYWSKVISSSNQSKAARSATMSATSGGKSFWEDRRPIFNSRNACIRHFGRSRWGLSMALGQCCPRNIGFLLLPCWLSTSLAASILEQSISRQWIIKDDLSSMCGCVCECFAISLSPRGKYQQPGPWPLNLWAWSTSHTFTNAICIICAIQGVLHKRKSGQIWIKKIWVWADCCYPRPHSAFPAMGGTTMIMDSSHVQID